jgi:phosphoribosylformimino-5-aminoimidazole carboxamide ribotide isomerase
MLIYPAIDLKEGRCVRLLHGRFDQVTSYDYDPFARLASFAADGAAWVHMVDLDGARSGCPVQHELIGRLAKSQAVKIQAGGGVRTPLDVLALLDAGVSRVVVGSMAVRRPREVMAWIADYGLDSVCLALDARPADGHFEVVVRGWTEDAGLTLDQAVDLFPPGALRHVLVTDVGRDGALTGANHELVQALAARRPDLQVQASGGVATLDDLHQAKAAGAAGAIVGRALYEGRFTLREALDAG